MKRLPIGLRLTLAFLLMFATGQLVFGLGMWITLHRDLYDIADDTLEGQIDDLQHFLQAQGKDPSTGKLQEEISGAYLLEHSGDYLQLREEPGDWIYRAAFLRQNDLRIPTAGELQHPLYEDRRIGHDHFRFLSEVLEVNGRRFVAQTGIPEDDILGTLHGFRRNLLLSALLILLFASAVGYWLSRRALAPVDAITRTARSINARNLNRRLEKLNTGDELQRLSDTLNEMLDRIESAFQRVSQFTADASHELRTPISLMRTEAEIALRKSRDEGEYREALGHILFEAERTSSMVEKLLALARADAGREALDFRRLDLAETVQEVVGGWRQVISAHRLELAENLADRDLFITGDKSAVARLCNILLDNAVKYTPAGGRIEIGLARVNGNAVLSVRDTGIGISEDDQGKIFERFYRADKARSREFGGTGLGLAIAHWIVEQHQGSITVKSSLGNGSRFDVTFSLLEESAS